MPKGVYAAASAMVVETRSLEATARNLANVQTPGFRREIALRTTFAEALAQQGRHGDVSGDGGAGVLPVGVYHAFERGELEATGAPLDLALAGDGFYQVRTDSGETLLTRAAGFSTDPQGRLITREGWQVQGQGGAITVPPDAGRIVVDRAGRISIESTADGITSQAIVDQLRIVTVEAPERMRARGGQYFDAAGQSMRDLAAPEVVQGSLERANVDPIHELVSMVAVQRRYDSAQKAMRVQLQAGEGFSDILRS